MDGYTNRRISDGGKFCERNKMGTAMRRQTDEQLLINLRVWYVPDSSQPFAPINSCNPHQDQKAEAQGAPAARPGHRRQVRGLAGCGGRFLPGCHSVLPSDSSMVLTFLISILKAIL